MKKLTPPVKVSRLLLLGGKQRWRFLILYAGMNILFIISDTGM
jgi:hypothetical protein